MCPPLGLDSPSLQICLLNQLWEYGKGQEQGTLYASEPLQAGGIGFVISIEIPRRFCLEPYLDTEDY